jgi:hypothetical protein
LVKADDTAAALKEGLPTHRDEHVSRLETR